jgi:hypothetical protein
MAARNSTRNETGIASKCGAMREEESSAETKRDGDQQRDSRTDGGSVNDGESAEGWGNSLSDGIAVFVEEGFAVCSDFGLFAFVGTPFGGGEETEAEGVDAGEGRDEENDDQRGEHEADEEARTLDEAAEESVAVEDAGAGGMEGDFWGARGWSCG